MLFPVSPGGTSVPSANDWYPFRQCGHTLSDVANEPTTNWPGFTDLTALPTSSTKPQYSCPIGVGPLIGCSPRYGQRSDPQTHVAAIRITASVGSMIFGSSRSSNRMSPGPYKTVPLIRNLLLLNDCHSAVRSQCVSHHVARPGTAQPQDGRSDFLRPPGAADRNALCDLRVSLLIPPPFLNPWFRRNDSRNLCQCEISRRE